MGTFMKSSFKVLLLLLVVSSVFVTNSEGDNSMKVARELVPAMFIFGDSLIDNGNNNNLASLAKANYYPYGIDFQGGPTGRFSNGYTMVDTIAEELGLPLIPAYSQASPEQMLHGVNYASAAAGILDITGRNFVGRIPFNQQIKNFENTLDQITGNNGAVDVAQSLSMCIFFVGMGSNDYLNNYLMPNYPTRNQYNGQQFANLLIQEYSQQLTRLYNLGARKFVLAGIGLMGCIPSMLAQSSNGHCSEEVNQLVLPFNTNVKAMMNSLSTNLPGSHFSYIDIRNMFGDILTNYRNYETFWPKKLMPNGPIEGRKKLRRSKIDMVDRRQATNEVEDHLLATLIEREGTIEKLDKEKVRDNEWRDDQGDERGGSMVMERDRRRCKREEVEIVREIVKEKREKFVTCYLLLPGILYVIGNKILTIFFL